MDHYHRTVQHNLNARLQKRFIKRLKFYLSARTLALFNNWYRNADLIANLQLPELKDIVTENWFKESYKKHQSQVLDILYDVAFRQMTEQEDKKIIESLAGTT